MRGLLAAVSAALALGLVLAPGARAGGFATVGLEPLVSQVRAGDAWPVRLTVLQHGLTPMRGITPTVRIRSGTVTRTFDAVATGEPGRFHAAVRFPAAGRWEVEVDDGFVGETHAFPPVRVTAPSRSWLASVFASLTPPRDVHPGERVWVAQGCGSCHDLGAAQAALDMGPDLAATLVGASDAYVRESILDPAADVPASVRDAYGGMPRDFSRRIGSGKDLDALVRYLRAVAGERF